MNKGKDVVSKPVKKARSGTEISNKDQKLLWSKAAGRCSFPECRIVLTMDTSEKSVTLGEMCHIVGEKNTAARGHSDLSIVDRSLYSNLILLCAHHHKIIDRNEKKYSIELLHKLKIEHELWVSETLSAKKLTPADLIYSSVIDNLSVSLQLDHWNWFIENAVRQLVHQEFIDAADFVTERQLAIVWPGTNIKLEEAIKKLMRSFLDYINQYLSFAAPSSLRNFFSPDRSYKKTFPNPHYDYYAQKHNLWARKNFLLLCLYTANVNKFADAVRNFYNPLFYVTRGKFLVIDSLGTHLGSWGSMLSPDENHLQKHLAAINKEIKDFQSKHKKSKPN